jgi:hypothetical protein
MAPAWIWSPTNCRIHESVADQHGPHLALPASVEGGVPSRFLLLTISQAKRDMASKRPKGEAVSMNGCPRLSGLQALRHGDEEHGFGTKREARAGTSGRRRR